MTAACLVRPICLMAPRVSPVAATKRRWTVRSDTSAGAPRSAAVTTGSQAKVPREKTIPKNVASSGTGARLAFDSGP
jgi:hypothetical protein